MISACRLKEVLKSPGYTCYEFEHTDPEDPAILGWYCEAFLFVLGLHPEGRFAHLEDVTYSSTETDIREFLGPYAGLESELQMTPAERLEIHARNSSIVAPSEFIALYIGSNRCGEGTPLYIDNEIH